MGQGGRGEIEASARPDRAGTGIWGLCLGASSRGVLPAASRWELHRHFTDEDAKAVLPGGRPSGNGLLQSQAPPPLLPPGSEPTLRTAHPSAVASWQGQWAIHHPTEPETAGPGSG